MNEFSRELINAYLEDALSETETIRFEKVLLANEEAQKWLRIVREERDRGEHSFGSIWRRERLSCPSREELNGYLHEILEEDAQAYIEFHLTIVACPTCIANRDDLREKQSEKQEDTQRRRMFLDSSAAMLSKIKME